MKRINTGPLGGFIAGSRPFNKSEKAFLRDIKKAKKLVDDNFSGGDSDALCDTMGAASEALAKIIKGLEPCGSQETL